MAERKTKRNAQRPKKLGDFRVCSEPVLHRGEDARSSDVGDKVPLPRVYDRPILFAAARDERTIFAGWNIDWRSVFERSMPADRQVYLRVINSDGSEQEKVAVEPMLAMHYLTISGVDGPHRVEIGYYQPAGTWHSIAISDEVRTMLQGSPDIAEVDLATIPFHLRFQRLINLFGPTDETPLAKVVSRFQTYVLNTRPSELQPDATQTLRELNWSLPAMAAERCDFEKTDTAKLAGRKRALLQLAGTSPCRGFEENAGL
jgi:hypothetical protein